MKQFTFFLIGVFFFILVGCGEITTEEAVAGAQQTIVVASIVPTITATQVPNEKAMVEKINAVLNDNKVVDDLSKAVDAHYQVMDIHFDPEGGPAIIFRVDALCICIKNMNCCVPERTFVVLAHTMKFLGKQFADSVPDTVLELHIKCNSGGRDVGTVMVSWIEMRQYIADADGGYQLGNSMQVQYP